MAGRKIFVGSLPNGIDDLTLRAEMGKYGTVEDVYIKQGCEPGRQWAFVTYSTAEQAQFAKDSCDRIVTFPGADRPCDVMMAKNQGMFGQQNEAGMASQGAYGGGLGGGSVPKKVFVGSLPDGIGEDALRAEFSKYGIVEDIYLKQNCEPGRQWAFVNFSSHDQAQQAASLTNNVLMFPGSIKAAEVTLARNQGMFGQNPIAPGPGAQGGMGAAPGAPRKIFVGSLPDGIDEYSVRAELDKYGQITEVFLKPNCEPGRQWGFVTFATPEQAQFAKDSCDRVLRFPGRDTACEVTMAKNQGKFGQDGHQDSLGGHSQQQQYGAPQHGQYSMQAYAAPAPAAMDGPRKVFVGSLPDSITDQAIRAEFSKYGQITDVFMKTGCEPGRQWCFVTFGTPDQAQYAKDSTDRVLYFPGADKPCEVMLAKNQGKFGQGGGGGGGGAPMGPPGGAQPPPPATPPPAHLTPWRMYKTAAGLPYYHNSVTGVTQWECPPELKAPGADPYAGYGAQAAMGHGAVRYSPY